MRVRRWPRLGRGRDGVLAVGGGVGDRDGDGVGIGGVGGEVVPSGGSGGDSASASNGAGGAGNGGTGAEVGGPGYGGAEAGLGGSANGSTPAGAGGTRRPVAPAGSTDLRHAARPRAWAELLRLPALFTVPGDALAGAAAAGTHANPRTALAICSSLCLYEAGMALNDWADRAEDAVERPQRPLPSGRIRPAAALAAACALTGAGLTLAAAAGRPALTVAVPLAATVWAYDLALKRTPAGPFAMATARGLDLLLGAAAATRGTDRAAADGVRRAVPSAALLGAHTLAVTTVSRRETQGGSPLAPLAALATSAVLTRLLTGSPTTGPGAGPARPLDGALRTALPAAYAATVARPYFHAVLNPSPPLTQRAVGGGIRAMIPLQSALAARSGATATALLTTALAPLATRFARKVSVT